MPNAAGSPWRGDKVARIFLNPDVEPYFSEYDFRDAQGPGASSVVPRYEAAEAVLIRNKTIDFDKDFLSAHVFPEEKQFKKLKSLRFMDGYFSSGADTIGALQTVFGGDRGKLRYFAEQMRDINAQVNAIVTALFPGYRFLNRSITWRMTETVNENLHVDVYNDDLPDHHVRLFVNLDVVPRIWHTSHRLEYLLAHRLPLLEPEFVRTATPGRICHQLNFSTFGGFELAGRDGHPRHIAFFEPGEVWLVDSRKVSHQIFYGRKALSTEWAVDPTSMDDPSKHYFAIVEAYRARLLAEKRDRPPTALYAGTLGGGT